MNRDARLIMEAMHSHAQRIITSELHKVHTILNQLSTMIDLNRSAETDQLLSKIRDASEMLMTDAPAENAESSASAHHRMRKDAFEGAGEEIGDGHIKVQLNADDRFSCSKAGAMQDVTFVKGTIFNCDGNAGDFYNCESDEYGTIAVFPDHVTVLHGEENAEHPDIDHGKADLNKDDELSAYELARAKAMTRAMGGAEQAEHSPAQHAAIAISLQKAGKKKK